MNTRLADRTTRALWLASALALAAACNSGLPGGGSGPGGDKPGSNDKIGEFACLSGTGVSAAGVAIDCNAAVQLTVPSLGKTVTPAGSIALSVGSIKLGKSTEALQVLIRNTKSVSDAASLKISKVEFGYNPGSPDETPDKQSLECFHDAALTTRCDKTTWKEVVPVGLTPKTGQADKESLYVRFTRFDAKDRTAKVTLHLGGMKEVSDRTFSFTVKTEQGKPKLELQPADGLIFPYTQPGKTEPKTFQAVNAGDAVLTLTSIKMAEVDPAYTIKLVDPADHDTEAHQGGKPWLFAKPLEIDVGKSAQFEVIFAPKDDKKKSGTVKFESTDPDTASRKLDIYGNTAVPALCMTPTGKYNFGGAVPGSTPGTAEVKIKNCGSVDLVVTSIDFIAGETKSNEFAIDQTPLFSKTKNGTGPISADNPMTLPINGEATFKVAYAPSDLTEDGQPPDIAVLTVKSNAFVSPKLQLEGVGVKVTCPIAKVIVVEGEQVVPQTTIHLKGDKSQAPGGGTIKKYKWTVKQPAGSNQPLLPNASFANPSILANASGEYEFCLEVWDANDSKSCVPACQKVLVIPNNALHIELLWDTPSDPDQTDSGPAAGADLDLHFAHPLASTLDLDCDGQADPWFSNPWDTFWFNAAPEWGGAGNTKDNPTLDLDDTDGAGPENLNLVDPEGTVDDPVAYHVGVHYWNDHGYGTSYATVSIYIQGGLALQFTKVKMDPLDMWFVGRVNWPNTASGGSKKVFDTCYQSGYSCPAKKNLMWQPKGDWCITKCYVNKVFNGSVGGAATQCKTQ
ncbi:MAG: hypothetical protein FJ100_01710 [Deltaproteobacteria bacterium]|nr:hypothetical protein [Deltaproteobacteria bacterium]